MIESMLFLFVSGLSSGHSQDSYRLSSRLPPTEFCRAISLSLHQLFRHPTTDFLTGLSIVPLAGVALHRAECSFGNPKHCICLSIYQL
ncbi:hypothetical protein IW262DRAFT_1403193 [Armillaria fumosa]|nr:hypothetical protein IW262DRAFT_1403193 [Armillaria fumosa]